MFGGAPAKSKILLNTILWSFLYGLFIYCLFISNERVANILLNFLLVLIISSMTTELRGLYASVDCKRCQAQICFTCQPMHSRWVWLDILVVDRLDQLLKKILTKLSNVSSSYWMLQGGFECLLAHAAKKYSHSCVQICSQSFISSRIMSACMLVYNRLPDTHQPLVFFQNKAVVPTEGYT